LGDAKLICFNKGREISRLVICKECGELVIAQGNKTMYCEDCANKKIAEQNVKEHIITGNRKHPYQPSTSWSLAIQKGVKTICFNKGRENHTAPIIVLIRQEIKEKIRKRKKVKKIKF
jgi:hypothetical protein